MSILAERLSDLGHTVVYWSSRFDHFHKKDRSVEECRLPSGYGYDIQLVDRIAYEKNIGFSRLHHNYRVKVSMKKMMEADPLKPDIIVADLPTIELADLCAELGKKWGTPTFICIRDLWPDVYLNAFPTFLRSIVKPFLTPLQRATNRALKNATGLIGISRGYLDWALKNANRTQQKQDRIISLGYPKRIDLSTKETQTALSTLSSKGVCFNRPICVFVGTFGHSYDLTTVIEAIDKFEYNPHELHLNPQFVFCGKGDNAEKWRSEAAKVIEKRKLKFPSSQNDIVFCGWLNRQELMTLLERSYLGLAAYAEGALQGLPNKFFEYMSYSLPILSSLSGEAAEEIRMENCGISYVAGDPEDLANKLSQIISNPMMRQELANNASVCFARKYEEAVIYTEYTNFIIDAAHLK